jgi:hypothetical protein
LISKWNSREYVQRFGIKVPELYWTGRRIHDLPFDQLPGRFAIRPIWGAGKRGIHVVADGQKLLGEGPADSESIRRKIVEERGRINLIPLLCEEAILQEAGKPRLPLEFKCHMFAGVVGAIQLIDRSARNQGFSTRYFDRDWVPFGERMADDSVTQLPPPEPPPYLPTILEWARELGNALGTYMRIDFFGTDNRCVFNEFSSTPGTHDLSPFGNDLLEALWQAHVPDCV